MSDPIDLGGRDPYDPSAVSAIEFDAWEAGQRPATPMPRPAPTNPPPIAVEPTASRPEPARPAPIPGKTGGFGYYPFGRSLGPPPAPKPGRTPGRI